MFRTQLRAATTNRPAIMLGVEDWLTIREEATILAGQHFREVEQGEDSRREFGLFEPTIHQCATRGWLQIITAREGEKLIGYLTWTLTNDVEAKNLLVADQGAWFLAPEPKVFGLAEAMFDFSVNWLKSLHVRCIYPHHRLVGRGARLGKFFLRKGARPNKQVYQLWIGDS